jgi:Bacterial extracellular solute-binding protein/von Willebrand factor type A domain
VPDAQVTTTIPCSRLLHVAATSSFAPVLAELAPTLETGESCLRLIVSVVEGRGAADRLTKLQADVWIPDDAAWVTTAKEKLLARRGVAHSGTVLATSPIFLVTDRSTAALLRRAGDSWYSLAELLARRSGMRLVVRDPAGSGDGLVGVGSLGDAVWGKKDMDASSLALIDAHRAAWTVTGPGPALPSRTGEVALVPEYALARSPLPNNLVAVSPADYTGLLRFTWLPTGFGYVRPDGAAALERLFQVVTAQEGAAAIFNAHLRQPDARQPPRSIASLMPALRGKPLEVLSGHRVGHVFAAWYPRDRRTNLLVVVDVSLSMSAQPRGADRPLISLVRDGCQSLGDLLPDDARLGLWEFGSELRGNGSPDHNVLLHLAPLSEGHRQRLHAAIAGLRAQQTGTGLHDTILAAYRSAVSNYRPSVLNQVLVFTDGKNEYDRPTITAQQLARELRRAVNHKRPVELTIAAFGSAPQIDVLEGAVKDVDAYVEHVDEAEEVAATFVHVAAGGGGH